MESTRRRRTEGVNTVFAIQQPNGQIDESSFLAVYVPGDTPSVYPKGYAKRLPAGATLVFQLHYTPNGKQRRDRSSLALLLCNRAEAECIAKRPEAAMSAMASAEALAAEAGLGAPSEPGRELARLRRQLLGLTTNSAPG